MKNKVGLLGLCASVATFWLFTQSIGVLVPILSKEFSIEQQVVTNVGSLSGLFSGVFIIAAGSLADRIGRKKITLIGLWANIIGCLILVFSPNIWIYAIGRVFQGISGACIMPATLALIKANYTDVASRQKAISYWSLSSWGCAGLSAIFAGLMSTFVNWRWIFISSSLVSLIAVILIARQFTESVAENQGAKMDYFGVLLLGIGLLGLNLAISTPSYHLGNKTIIAAIALVAVGVIGLYSFYRLEKKLGAGALINLAILENKQFDGATVSNFFLNFAAGSTMVFLTFLQNQYQMTSMLAGFMTIGYLIALIILIQNSTKILRKIGYKNAMVLGISITIFGALLMSLSFMPKNVYMLVSFTGMAVIGAGFGIYATPSTDKAVEQLSTDNVGTGSGVYKMASSLGGSFGVLILGGLYGLNTIIGSQFASMISYFVLTAILIIALIVVIKTISPEKK